MVYKEVVVKISPHEKRVGEYHLERSDMVMGCHHLCTHMNIFMLETLQSVGVFKKDIKLSSMDFVDSFWDKVPGTFKKIMAYKDL